MNNKGLSIVEFMIAIALGLIVIAGGLVIFSTNKQSFTVQNGLARIQENGRYAKFILSHDIRMVGFQGCPNLTATQPVNLVNSPADNELFSNDNAILGFEGGTTSFSPSLPSWLINNLASGTSIVPNTDVIVIRSASSAGSNLTTNMAAPSADIEVDNQLNITPNSLLLISDCESTDLFKASSGSTNGLAKHAAGDNTSDSLSKVYQTDARLYLMQVYAYYLKATGRTNQAGQPIYALYRQDNSGNEVELFDGVETMQITYGIDTNNDGTADTYSQANQISAADWANVVSIDIALLLSTVENVSDKPIAYNFQGVSITPTDRMLRRQWDTFITLRNRI